MDRLFLDANVLFSAAYRSGAGLLQLWKIKNVALCSSRYAFEEARINLVDDNQRTRLLGLSGWIEFFDSTRTALPPGITLPEKDGPILLAAVEARATHLLTGDVRHFGPYFRTKIAGMRILLPGDYLRMRSSNL